MGGANQSTSSPPPASAQVPRTFKNANQVRVHTNNNEAHFHDDTAGLKVVIPEDDFKLDYANWRDSCKPELTLHGTDGSGGAAKVSFHTYPGVGGTLEIAMVVEKSNLHAMPHGQSVMDLDLLAGL